MANAWKSVLFLLGAWAVAQTLVSAPAEAELNPSFYKNSCPQVFSIVGNHVQSAIQKKSRVAASILRVHFHDCFVQGCDASVLLDSIPNSPSEKTSLPNKNSLTEAAFDTIDKIKTAVEKSCPNVVSCADVLTLASFFSIVLSGGPAWTVPLGRRDSLLANFNETINLPGPDFNITVLKSKFTAQKLSTTDLVALSGGHTIGRARCATIRNRLYNFTGTAAGGSDPTLNPTFLKSLEKGCPKGADGNQLNVTFDIDIQTPTVFDNLYYKNILAGEGLFRTDQELLTAASDTKALVQLYARDQTKFFADFTQGMINMGNLNVLTGSAGQIRKHCRVRNPPKSVLDKDEQIQLQTDVEQNEGDIQKLEQFVANVVKDIILGAELERLVEDTVSGPHASV